MFIPKVSFTYTGRFLQRQKISYKSLKGRVNVEVSPSFAGGKRQKFSVWSGAMSFPSPPQ